MCLCCPIGYYALSTTVTSCFLTPTPVPTRDTSFTHLRDAFVRAVGARMLLRRKSGELSDEDSIELATPMRKLKTLFPNSPLKKHVPLDIFLTPPIQGRPRALIFRDLGGIESDWMSVEFILHYFDGKHPPSPPVSDMLLLGDASDTKHSSRRPSPKHSSP